MTVASEVARWAIELRPDDVPDEVLHAARRHLLDAVGNALAAARVGDAAPAVTVARGLGGPAQARILGDRDAIGAPAAAFGTGALVHALDFDDTHAGGLVHVSAVVAATALAVGQQVGATGTQTLTALVVGSELMCRLGAASPHGFHAGGLHATSVCGPLAAAVVAARLTGADEDVTTHALGIAGSSAGGLLEFLHTGSSTKALHPGLAASAGIIAARLAAAGATGPSSVLEGEYGVYAALSSRPADPASITDGLGVRWETTRVTIKPYPACQLVHAGLDAVATLDVRAEDVRRVVVDVHPDAIDIVCEPRPGKLAPRSPYDAKFSLPWSIAALLVDGAVGIDTYSAANIRRPDIAELARRVDVTTGPSGGAAADAPGRVTVTTVDGRELDGYVAVSAGGPAHPLDDTTLQEKFERNVADDRTDLLAKLIMDLDSLPDLGPLLDAASSGGSA